MNRQLASIIVCPNCRAALTLQDEKLWCSGCGHPFRYIEGVPVFLDGPIDDARQHLSNRLGAEFEAILRAGSEFVLNIGAGGTPARYPNCIELEHKIFAHTDVVADAHRLPFRDSVFDRVFAFNVFEHLREPRAAAQEIERVLKPGGRASIHTAFLQPLHESPHHFYNATEFGVREWFSAFEIERCAVTGNFGPGMMLAFLTANLLEAAQSGGLTTAEQTAISTSTLGEWAAFWTDRTNPPASFHTLQNLPQPAQARVAAGFELIARKRIS